MRDFCASVVIYCTRICNEITSNERSFLQRIYLQIYLVKLPLPVLGVARASSLVGSWKIYKLFFYYIIFFNKKYRTTGTHLFGLGRPTYSFIVKSRRQYVLHTHSFVCHPASRQGGSSTIISMYLVNIRLQFIQKRIIWKFYFSFQILFSSNYY